MVMMVMVMMMMVVIIMMMMAIRGWPRQNNLNQNDDGDDG